MEARLGGRNFIYCLPRVRWPKLTLSGSKWLEVVSGVRLFVDMDRQSGFGDYIIHVRRSALSKLAYRLPRDFPEDAEKAFSLAEAVRWEYLFEPEKIF